MNYTKLTFSFRTKEAESSFFRNFTILLVVLHKRGIYQLIFKTAQ